MTVLRIERNIVYDNQIKLYISKSTYAQVFVPFATTFHAAEIVVQTVFIKHCDQSSGFGDNLLAHASRNVSSSELFLS